jgi:hypothetical protein
MRYAFRAVGGHDKNHNVITAAEPGAAPDRLQRPLLRRFRFRRRVSFGVRPPHFCKSYTEGGLSREDGYWMMSHSATRVFGLIC